MTIICECHVEGKDDEHTLVQLLARYGIKLDKDLGPVAFKSAGCDTKLLEFLPTAIRASSNRAVGFIIDADDSAHNRWHAISAKLREFSNDLPASCPEDGFISDIPELNSRVGVWIMPDNIADFAKLENLLKELVPENDLLISHAESSVDHASSLGANFSDRDRIKSVIHTWLAWQAEPGLPYGLAIKAKYFSHRTCVSDAFCKWFCSLFATVSPELETK